MALVNCPECTHKISDRSVSCTNCGFPIVKPTPSQGIPPSYEELKRIKERNLDKAFEELEELEEKEYGFFTNTNMFIIACIIIYFTSKDEIVHIFNML